MGIERTGLDIIIRTPGAKESAEEVKRLGDATSGLSAPATQAGKALGDLTDKTKTTGDELKKKGDVVDQVSEKLGKKFVSAGT